MKTNIKIIHWVPRVICILAILFISVFAFDAFEERLPFRQQLANFFMHLIPTYFLIVLLIIAWKREFIGGIIYLLIGIVSSPFIFLINHNRNHFSIGSSLGIVAMTTFPFIIAGILFVISHYMKKKRQL
ncbi:DUF7670 domain-containing protein [Flavobacterium luteum]|uniref:DUF7670 domain-containing protein n=1 Tax=Flavobacterium luteum TaxID=2026654 RepID=A0A7J5A9G1_9FLAO|nr:hypothetical protein [Flavobacterium luteum]KAB1154113.1 hypothetical protein F6464_13500 [Flavobacterium luteum]